MALGCVAMRCDVPSCERSLTTSLHGFFFVGILMALRCIATRCVIASFERSLHRGGAFIACAPVFVLTSVLIFLGILMALGCMAAWCIKASPRIIILWRFHGMC
jgi:hypothetical protein